jgi:predicted helicase
MRRVAPSVIAREQLQDLLAGGADREMNIVSALVDTVTRLVVDTFLSESARPQFAFRLLIATTNHLGRTARRTLAAQEKPAHVLFLGELERAQVTWPVSPKRLIAPPSPPKRPRPHQRAAVRDVVSGLKTHSRGQLIMACGTGKTLVGISSRATRQRGSPGSHGRVCHRILPR